MTTPFFDRFWKAVTKSVFRLEMLPEYRVEGDLELFHAYLRGEPMDPAEIDSEWFHDLGPLSRKGVKLIRVRIVDVPLNNYVRYEIEWGYRISQVFGEQVMFLERKAFEALIREVDVKLTDFWLFDDTEVVLFLYTPDGGWIGEKLVPVGNAGAYAKVKKILLDAAEPFEAFLVHHGLVVP